MQDVVLESSFQICKKAVVADGRTYIRHNKSSKAAGGNGTLLLFLSSNSIEA